jgi:sirohydrochlorin cobaltochelatase
MNKTCLILLTHGSKRASWCKPFQNLLRKLRRETGKTNIHLAHMELAAPSLEDVVGRVVKEGVTAIRVLPLFMSSGTHLIKDIPKQVKALTRQHRGLKIVTLPPLGSHPRFLKMMLELTQEYV